MEENHVIKLTGKAELPKPLVIGHNFRTIIEGSITAETISDNQDGTKTHYYKFEPVIVETIDELGERMRAKDTRSRSQQLRSLLFKMWREQNVKQEFEDFYEEKMLEIIGNLY